ncbi:hypothetical protein M472_07660 [Sphingobacterium paucimobilis HER1398]|uniref:Uncharacterized protein n=2 Tax=Sphingobacterium TaxID=28453 RepID=U2J117_9SPHI|nr:hypothetical protein M472_07660 [Sphingobacterium paucimobilis HER1398]
MWSCDKEKQLPLDKDVKKEIAPIDLGEEDQGEDVSTIRDYMYTKVFMTADAVDMGGSAMDLASGKVYRGTNMHNYAHAIDFLYMDYGNGTKGNIVLPASRELSVNILGEDVQYGWRHKNEGVLYRLDMVSSRDMEWFNSANSAERISILVDSMIHVLSTDPTHKKDRYRNIKTNEIYVFKSLTRGISSLIHVNQQINAGDGSQCRLEVKSDTSRLQAVTPISGGLINANGNYYADKMEITFQNLSSTHEEYYIDFKKKKFYTQSELQAEDYANINFILGRRSSNGELYLFTPTSAPGKTNYNSSTLSAHLTSLQNAGHFLTWKSRLLSTHSSYNTKNNNFENTRLNNTSIYQFYASILNNGWASHYTVNTDARDLVGRVYSVSNRPDSPAYNQLEGRTDLFFAVFKFVEYDSGTGRVVIDVKSYNSLD